MREIATAATHDGTFHADDAFAAAILELALGSVQILRTRDPRAIASCDLAFDVGGLYDPDRLAYDHHMAAPPARPCGTPYSSAGLIWRDFGRLALAREGLEGLPASQVERAWASIDEGAITSIDKIDNGVTPPGPTDVATLIDALNPTWTEGRPRQGTDALFEQARQIALAFLRRLIAAELAAIEAEGFVMHAAARREDPRILVLDAYAPFKRAVARNGLDEVLYAVLPSGTAGDWGVSAMSVTPDSFVNRKDLPAAWGGLTDGALQAVTGVPDARFAHRSLFFALAGSKEGALALARLAVASEA